MRIVDILSCVCACIQRLLWSEGTKCCFSWLFHWVRVVSVIFCSGLSLFFSISFKSNKVCGFVGRMGGCILLFPEVVYTLFSVAKSKRCRKQTWSGGWRPRFRGTQKGLVQRGVWSFDVFCTGSTSSKLTNFKRCHLRCSINKLQVQKTRA